MIQRILFSGIITLFLSMQFITRVILCTYAIWEKKISIIDIPLILCVGEINDLMAACYLLPIVGIIAMLMKTVAPSKIFKILRTVAHFISINLFFVVLVIELLFWDEFGTRFNFIAVDYLIYTHEIIGTVKDSLPSVGIVLTLSILINVCLVIPIVLISSNAKLTKFKDLLITTCVAVFGFCFYSSEYSWISNNYTKELGKNGYYEFFSAVRHNTIDYTQFYPMIEESTAIHTVRDLIQPTKQTFIGETDIERKIIASHPQNNYNVILIVIESMDADFMGSFGNVHNLTPELDKLSKDGILFTNFYATGTRTVRGLEAITLSVPPSPGSSIIRRFNNDNLFNIASVLKDNGYKSIFLYGGYSYFDNMFHYFSNNQYHVVDRADFSNDEIAFSNVWAITDESVFNKAIKIADSYSKKNQPFFLLTLTASNHRPYTFPEGRIELKSGTRHGAVKYTDYAIGNFITQSRSKDWFDNTIFVIVADHCASGTGRISLPINKYHIPLIFYAPKILPPSKNNTLSSQIDIAPSILGLLNISYVSNFWGQDLFDTPQNRAFITTYQLLGYLKNNYLVVLAPQKHPVVYSTDNEQQLAKTFPDKLVDEAISIYEESYLLFKRDTLKLKN